MKIEIYGIPEDVHRCAGCRAAKQLCDDRGLDYQFIPIVRVADTPLGFEYVMEAVEELKTRAGKQSAPTNYPQIFVNDKWIGSLKTFKEMFPEY